MAEGKAKGYDRDMADSKTKGTQKDVILLGRCMEAMKSGEFGTYLSSLSSLLFFTRNPILCQAYSPRENSIISRHAAIIESEAAPGIPGQMI